MKKQLKMCKFISWLNDVEQKIVDGKLANYVGFGSRNLPEGAEWRKGWWSAGVPRHKVNLPGVGRGVQQVGAVALAQRGPVHGGGAGLLLRAGQRVGRGSVAVGGAAARCRVHVGAATVGVPGAEPAQEADRDSEMSSHTAPVSAPHPVTAAGDAAGE